MFMSFVMLVPVNMLNVTRVTLSHNRIACKYNCLSQIFENLIKSNFCRREQEVLFRFIYAWLCCGTYGIISKFGYQFGINEVYLIWKHPRISWWCHSKCQQTFFLEYWTISSIRAFINNNFCEFLIKFAQESQQQYVFPYEINETASNSLDFGRNIWKTSILKIINFFIPFIHVLQQFRLVSQIWRIWKFWIWPTITSKNCRCQFHQCPNFAFWICQSIDSLHCLGDLVPSQFLKYSIYHTITWAKTLCPETFSWWVR